MASPLGEANGPYDEGKEATVRRVKISIPRDAHPKHELLSLADSVASVVLVLRHLNQRGEHIAEPLIEFGPSLHDCVKL